MKAKGDWMLNGKKKANGGEKDTVLPVLEFIVWQGVIQNRSSQTKQLEGMIRPTRATDKDQ